MRFLLYVGDRWSIGGVEPSAIVGLFDTAEAAAGALGSVESYSDRITGYGCALAQVIDLEEREVVRQWGSTHPGEPRFYKPGQEYTYADSFWEEET